MENLTAEETKRLLAAELINESCAKYRMEANYKVPIDYDGQDDLIIENCTIETILDSRKSWNEKGTMVRHALDVVEFIRFQVLKGQSRDNRLVVEIDGVCYWSN